ncbi:hypothetical protein L228DRAFT_242231 [Xylona heveae TC161]|uniref:Uncharacterized protein n=1 Tax=Xylona heveae (strain CBS 132557 / TC161) TaxID=1328760 RepID=A0A165J7P8_XYLHT|nr:hypothetical protein L228DRAFT_242231 [Xylona heveae TC161]KZF25858.1 hypothetical protein L228DRAFT_242231 [Xylona heveae TC161]
MAPATSLLSLIATALLAAQSVAALGCFGSGETYGQVTSDTSQLASARSSACNSFAGSYPQGASRSLCASFPDTGTRINFSASNTASTPQTLTYDDCEAALTIEMNGCKRGSRQKHGNFEYLDDPNNGTC